MLIRFATGEQKVKNNEEECGRKIQELQGELASVREERQKLERKVWRI